MSLPVLMYKIKLNKNHDKILCLSPVSFGGYEVYTELPPGNVKYFLVCILFICIFKQMTKKEKDKNMQKSSAFCISQQEFCKDQDLHNFKMTPSCQQLRLRVSW